MRTAILWTPEKRDTRENIFKKQIGGNIGNLVYLNGVEKVFKGQRIYWYSDPDLVNNSFDFLVFPAANQLGNHTDLGQIGRIWSQYKVPILCLGLGIQSEIAQEAQINNETFVWIKEIVDNSKKFGNPIFVRGEKTKRFLDKLFPESNIEVFGCPSQFLLEEENPSIKKTFGKIIVYGADLSWETRATEMQLLDEVSKTDGRYVVNGPPEGYLASIGENTEQCLEYIRCFNKKFETKDDWFFKFCTGYLSYDDWEKSLDHFDYSVGFRIHGCILNTLKGIPSLLIAVDERTIELCETLNLPFIINSDYENIIEKSKEILMSFDYQKTFSIWRGRCKNILKKYLSVWE